MKRFNQIIACVAVGFIAVTVMLWILNAMVTFLGLIFLKPIKAFAYVILGAVLVYGLSKVKTLL